ncbi:MAG: hypothetical protein U1C71_03630, partial [archaeon]|nr:hypothetical protein [archaeon]
DWEKTLLIGNDWSKEHFSFPEGMDVEWIVLHAQEPFEQIKEQIAARLDKKSYGVCLSSGSGKEHSALLAALLEKRVKWSIAYLSKSQLAIYGGEKDA